MKEPRRDETLLMAEAGPEGPGEMSEWGTAEGLMGGVAGTDMVPSPCRNGSEVFLEPRDGRLVLLSLDSRL